MLVLPAELTHAQALTCLDMLRQSLKGLAGDTVVVDAEPLKRFDTSALAVLLECRRDCLYSGRVFRVRGLGQRLRELAELYGIAELLESETPAVA
mgnify:FL=1